MKTVGIVCEYNPFHTGHKRQLDILRENGAKTIICAMSGNFSQRGELTVADKYTRAEAAIRCGADIVIELPFPYSSLSAEGFCSAGVHILSSLGCDTLSFGSESADKAKLLRAASIVSSDSFVQAYAAAQKNQGTAKAYFDLLSSHFGEDCALLSNDILAISYISAIQQNGLNMDVFPVKREGAAYTETKLENEYPSASAIREALKNSGNSFDPISDKHMPTEALGVFRQAQENGLGPVFNDKIRSDILSFFKLMSPHDITTRAIKKSLGGGSVCCDGCGIVERLCNSAKKAIDFEDFLKSAYNSRYTDARINRVMLFSIIGVSDLFEKKLPEYALLLGASKSGRKHLSEIRKSTAFPIVTKPADIPEGCATDLLCLSDSFYTSAIPKPVNFDYFIKKHPYMG